MSLLADQRELTWRLDAETGKATTDIQKVDKELDKVKTNMQSIDKQSGVFGKLGGGIATVGSKIQSVGSGIQTLGSNISRVGSGISNFSGKLGSAGAKMTAFAAPVALAFKKGVDGALELDTAIRQVTTLADQDVLPVGKIEQEVRRISDATGIAQKEISESMYEALSSGIDSADVVGFVEQGVQLTKAGFTDMPTVIDATTTALNAYGLQGAEATSHIQDVMVKTQDLGKITVDELGKNIGRVVPFASAAGVSIDQLGAGYSVLTAKGQNAAIATTNLSALISELNTTGSTADKALRKGMGQSFKEMMDSGQSLGDVLQSLSGIAEGQGLQLGDMFGNKMATSAANTLLADGPDQFNTALDAMVNSGGSVEANFEKMQGPAEKLRQTQNRLKNSFIEMGASMIPVFEQFASGVSKIAEKFNSLDDGTKQMIGKVALVLTVVGPILAVVGTIGSAIGTIISGIGSVIGFIGSAVSAIGSAVASAGGAMAVITGPVGIAIGVVMALVAAGVALYKNWDTVKEKAAIVGEAIKTGFGNALEFIKGLGQSVGQAIGGAFEFIGGVISTIVGVHIAALKMGFQLLVGIAHGVASGIGTAFQFMGNLISTVFSGAVTIVSGIFQTLIGVGQSVANGIGMAFQFMGSLISTAVSTAVSFVSGLFNNLLSIGQTIASGISTAFSTLSGFIRSALGGAINAVIGMFNRLRGGAISAINGIKSAWQGLKNLLSAPINAVVNIGKGIGGAIKGAVGKVTGHADGLYNVPYDEYPAMLHKGEMVVTAEGSNQLRAMGATENGFANPPMGEPTSSLMGDLRPSVTNNESSTSNSSNFSPVINVTVNGNGNGSDASLIADIVEEKIMGLFTTANLQRG